MRWRRVSQLVATLVSNPYLPGLFSGTIYMGSLKYFCTPGFNCYSCPLAVFACPIGTLQWFVAHGSYHLSLYVLGFLAVVGALGGRFVCGWLCPFGFFQELLHKIPSRKIVLPRWSSAMKYVVLVGLVLVLPFATKQPWFCKLCPAGTLEAGIPLAVMNESLRSLLGWFFGLKLAILAAFLALMVISYRPFCKVACPLGAIYSLFNRISLISLRIDREACTNCGKCKSLCPVDIDASKEPDSPECIRCLDCRECEYDAIEYGMR